MHRNLLAAVLTLLHGFYASPLALHAQRVVTQLHPGENGWVSGSAGFSSPQSLCDVCGDGYSGWEQGSLFCHFKYENLLPGFMVWSRIIY